MFTNHTSDRAVVSRKIQNIQNSTGFKKNPIRKWDKDVTRWHSERIHRWHIAHEKVFSTLAIREMEIKQ